ncbi:MAG: 7-cyano-7-deazaguanine synthase, partial [Clostridia bacterium]|nr:7-cyano-7-deazaguanine synthase [Clostridia bacterium]
PYSTAGNGLLLLSGGIDSPVAGYMMAKRGLKLFALHFHSFPYTSLQAKQKVIKLATLLKEYCGDITLICCPFTKIQEEIHKNCDSDFMITIMRRIMMKIASKVCDMYSCGAIITGENLGQVASQTMESMTVTNFSQTKHPIFRPLIAFDKQDIIEVATKINTYETSILPYEDCCTVFLPKNPVIKPKIEKVLKQEQYLDIQTLIEEALNNLEIIEC